MKPEEVLAYLQDNPQFFEHHAREIAEIAIPHPDGGRAISISERQILALRDKARQLESKLREVIQFGEENDVIGAKVHRLALALIAAPGATGLADAVQFNLREDFAVPHVALRVWRVGGDSSRPEFSAASAATMDFAASLTQPYCSPQSMVDTATLFGEAAPHLRSFAYVTLRDTEAFGLLALASEDPKRFYPEMGSLFLARIGDMVSAGLARHLG